MKNTFGLFLVQLIWPVSAFAQTKSIDATMAAVVDTLIPADALSPSGSALAVPHKIITEAQAHPRVAAMLIEGCAWLDQEASGAFAELDETARAALLRRAEAQNMSNVRTFFVHMRKESMRLYYAHPEASRGFTSYTGTPQPRGYPDYATAPQSSLP